MSISIWAFLIGLVSGSRTLTAPAAISWAAFLGWINLKGTPFTFLHYAISPIIFTILALLELVYDKLPKTPSRKAPPSFAARVAFGALSGAAVGAAKGSLAAGFVVGALGAVTGLYGGYELRKALGSALGKDLPAALFEDVIAIGLAFVVVTRA